MEGKHSFFFCKPHISSGINNLRRNLQYSNQCGHYQNHINSKTSGKSFHKLRVDVMPSSVKVPWEIRLGDVGEAEIKGRLSYFSVPTKFVRDVGIDFYCELLEEDSPLMPFYVQAKGTEHIDDNWGASVKKSTIIYWLQQPFPVFLVVYDENTENCYWMSIEDYRYSLIQKIFETTSETIYLKIDKSHILEKGKGKNDEFIKKIKDDLISI